MSGHVYIYYCGCSTHTVDLFLLFLPSLWKDVKLTEGKAVMRLSRGYMALPMGFNSCKLVCIRAAAEDPACTSDARRDGTDMAVRLDAVQQLGTRRRAITCLACNVEWCVIYHIC